MTPDQLATTLSRRLPVESPRATLKLAEAGVVPASGGLGVTLWLILWDVAEDGARSICDIKEQVAVLSDERLAHPRLEAFFDGWREALLEVFRVGKNLHGIMPVDLLPIETLDLKRPRTPDDYTEAMLGARARLGHLWEER